MTIRRQIIEGRLIQGVDERIVYTLTTTPWGSDPTGIQVKAYDTTANAKTDVSATVLAGQPSATGDVITLPMLIGLTDGHLYRIEVLFVCSGNTFEAYAEVLAEQ